MIICPNPAETVFFVGDRSSGNGYIHIALRFHESKSLQAYDAVACIVRKKFGKFRRDKFVIIDSGVRSGAIEYKYIYIYTVSRMTREKAESLAVTTVDLRETSKIIA